MEFVKFSDKYEFIYGNHQVQKTTPRLQLHYHDVMELYFVTEGACTYFINDKSYDVEKGDIIIIPQGVLHKVNISSEQHSYMILYLKKCHIPYSVIEYLKQIPYLYRNPNIADEIFSILFSIEKKFNHPDKFSNDEILLYVHMLFFLLIRNLNTVMPVKSNNGYIKEILQYIQAYYFKNITLEDLSTVFSLSPEHISRLFKKETGFNFIEYLTAVRMHEAEKFLLQNKKMPISEIAAKCGYNDSNYFSERFKQIHQLTPSQFRKNK